MSKGTITLTNGAAAAVGAGTAFTQDLNPRDFIVVNAGGISYTVSVLSIESDTSLTLASKFAGPTMAGLAWQAAPFEMQGRITEALQIQTAEAVRFMLQDRKNWQAILGVAGDITVLMPDSSSFSGPSWRKVINLLNDIDVALITAMADAIKAAAQQVAADKADALAAAESAGRSAQSAQLNKEESTTAASEAVQAKEEAVSSAQQALQSKQEVGDVAAALAAIKGVGTLPLGFTFWWASRATIPTGAIAYDGQILPYATYPGVKEGRDNGSLEFVTDAVWQADVSKRTLFATVDADHFRCPDLNGAQPGSIAQPTLTGGTAAQAGLFHGEIPNIKGNVGIAYNASYPPSKLFKVSTTIGAGLTPAGGTAWGANQADFDFSTVSSVFKDIATDILAARAVGVWCGQLFGRISNPGSVDGATLSTRMEVIYAELLSRFSKSFISGFNVIVSAASISVSPGSYYDPGSGLILSNPATISKAIPVTVANTWYHLYLFKNGASADIEISVADPVNYSVPAKIKTGDISRRYIGSFRTGNDNAVNRCALNNGVCDYFASWANRLTILSAGVALVETPLSVSTLIPSTAFKVILEAVNVSPAQDCNLYSVSGQIGAVVRAMKDFIVTLPVYSSSVFYAFTGSSAPQNGLYIYGGGYHYER